MIKTEYKLYCDKCNKLIKSFDTKPNFFELEFDIDCIVKCENGIYKHYCRECN